MKYEVIYYNRRGDGFVASEVSHIYNEVPDDLARQYMKLQEDMGLTRGETSKQIFYSKRINYHESMEVIFWKE